MEYPKKIHPQIVLLSFILISTVAAQEIDSLGDTLKPKLDVVPEMKSVMKQPVDKWFGQDKFLHFYFSATMVGLSYHTLVCRLERDEKESKIVSISFTAVVGLGKELYDKKKKSYFSWKDLCWDGAGLAIGYFAFIHRY